MPGTTSKRKKILFVDDEPGFLAVARDLFAGISKGSWQIFTAQNHAEGLALLQKERLDLVVLDIGMPVMDGVQFLRLLNRTNPGQAVVMLTGKATPENRATCVENGAALVLEKPIQPSGYAEIFAVLDALAASHAQPGFRGMMRSVGLQEVLQIECLGRKSSVLDVFTGKVRGRIYICDGAIIHAESGELKGDQALYSLLALHGGGFNLLPFSEPSSRTITGPWEFLVMEAARLSDELAEADRGKVSVPEDDHETSFAPDTNHTSLEAAPPEYGPSDTTITARTQSAPSVPPPPARSALPHPSQTTHIARTPQTSHTTRLTRPGSAAAAAAQANAEAMELEPVFKQTPPGTHPAAFLPPETSSFTRPTRIVEVALCSGTGELLYDWQCKGLAGRLRLLEHIEKQATEIAALLPVGRFDRLELVTQEGRAVCQVQPDRRLFVRSAPADAKNA